MTPAQAGTLRTVQELLGHSDVSTTMIDTHVLNRRLVQLMRGKAPMDAEFLLGSE